MSVFSDVDGSANHDRVLRFLDRSARGESGIKNYVVAAHAIRDPAGPILDVGCGAGHDIELFASAGMRIIGIDPSAVLLRAAALRVSSPLASLVQGTGESLPFCDGAFAGCRIERVLMHVVEPAVVLAETVRCLQPGSLVTVFEPDWSGFTVRDAIGDQNASWVLHTQHPDAGARLWDLLEQAGCEILDRVEELSIWRRLETLDYIVGIERSLERSVQAGRITADGAATWLATQRARDAQGDFYAVMPKVLVVATKR